MLTPFSDEIYRCYRCNKDFDYSDIRKDWKCPKCGKPLSVRAEIGNKVLSINRISPSCLKVNNLFRLYKDNCYLVLACYEQENGYYIALEKYGHIIVQPDEFVSIVMGAWK
jgi:predicted RNA-binding Zn-ribbon protein involved in translation (DUF1610 family)